MSLLGIDVGTSGCKAAVFSEEGRLLASAYDEYDYQHLQPGWAELDARQVWDQIQRTICKAASGVTDPVRALSVSSLGEAFVPVTADRQILGPSMLNFDTRGAEFLPQIREWISSEDWYAINGNTPGNNYSLTKLLWLKQYQPELYEKADFFLHWGGFVTFMLGADPTVDYSLANRTLLFDLAREDWSDTLLGMSGIAREKLPVTIPSGKVIGTLSRSAAEGLGLPAGIPIVSGGHDQVCSGLGCGVIAPGQAMYGMGTYICMMPVYDRRPAPAAMIERGFNTEHHSAPGHYVSFIYNQGGALVKWFRDTFAAVEREQARAAGEDPYPALLAEMPVGPSRVMALPHFTVTGPPRFIDDSSGVIAGVRLETTRGEILKGLIEATTFYIRECFETLPGAGIEISDFRASGGGSKSDAWLQVCADIMGRPFTRPSVIEAGALGAAILAGTGSGVFPSIEAGVEQMVHLEKTFTPNPEMQKRYDERFALYRKLAPLMESYLRELG